MSRRHRFFFVVIALVLCAFAARLIFLQLIKHDFYRAKAANQFKRVIHLYPNRGTIYDRNLTPLALTQPSYHIYAIPADIENKWEFAQHMGRTLDIDRKSLSDTLYKTKSPFLWVSRHCSEDQMKAVKALDLAGLGIIKTKKRVYPYRDIAAHVLGFVGIDNQGLAGIEFKYDDVLRGSAGKIVLDKDPKGTPLLSGNKTQIARHDGQTIVTTIDSNIQFVAQQALLKTVEKYQAESGQVIIMSPKTGDILAMVSIPTYNPNMLSTSSNADRRARPVTDMFEPGSIFKMITLASVIEEDIVSAKTTLNVPETYKLHDKVIKEAHDRKPGEGSSKTVTEIIEESLNVGTTLLALKLGEERLYKYIQDFGFGAKTQVQLPGESKGLLRPLNRWSGVDIGMISFGQGIAVTGLQMVAAYGAIANEGRYVKPRVIRYFSNADQTTRRSIPVKKELQVVSPETATEVSEVLRQVVERGTAKGVRLPGYSVAGKTGTAQKPKANGRGYDPGKYVASFIGFFPVEDPEIVMLVAVDSPQRQYYGSVVAGPVFKQCAEFLVDYLNIPPRHLMTKVTSRRTRLN